MASNQVEVRKRILFERQQNPNLSVRDLAKKLKLPKSTIFSVCKSFDQRLTVDRKVGSGTNRKVCSQQMDKKVVAIIEKNPNLSVRNVARKVGKSKSYVQKVKQRQGLKTYKVKKVPNRDDKQNFTAKIRAKELYTKFLQNFSCVIMDDETYVVEDFRQLPGLGFYTAMQRNAVAERFRTKKVSKFPKKYLIWQAICSCGRKSKCFVSTGTINKDVYEKECLQKRLLPFIRSHDSPALFWPDLASCHYAKSVLEWYKVQEVNYVPKEANPPNCPELRPIEKYWALVKRKLFETKKKANGIDDFKRRWRNGTEDVSEDTVRNLMAGVPQKVREFYRKKD